MIPAADRNGPIDAGQDRLHGFPRQRLAEPLSAASVRSFDLIGAAAGHLATLREAAQERAQMSGGVLEACVTAARGGGLQEGCDARRGERAQRLRALVKAEEGERGAHRAAVVPDGV